MDKRFIARRGRAYRERNLAQIIRRLPLTGGPKSHMCFAALFFDLEVSTSAAMWRKQPPPGC
jgi:hypothetical protein